VADLRAAHRAWASYRGASPGVRAFLLGRLANAPLGALDADLRALRGRVLSLGAGYGLVERYLAEINPDVTVEGVELNAGRVRVAAATSAAAPRVRIREADVRDLPEAEPFAAALAIDVLHHLPQEDQGQVIAALRERLAPRGTLLVKDIATTPRWKHAINRAHDRLVAGPEPIHCRAPDDMAAVLESAGLEVTAVRRLSPANPYPHYLVHATAP
jgi:cyclopropane fatty-acyl-phospholipid synthase-like methyltransferase